MRRRRGLVSSVPERLRRFDAAEWPGDEVAAFEAWRRARLEYHAEHPTAWPDAITVLQGSRNAWLKAGGLLPMHPGADEWEVNR